MARLFERIKRLVGRHQLTETDMGKVDAAMLDDPTLSPTEKLQAAFMQFHRSYMRERHEEMAWKRRRNIALIAFAIAGTVTSIVFNADRITKNIIPRDHAAVVNILGEIGVDPTAKHGPINEALKQAFEDPRVKRVILRIDSPGGQPNESEAIIEELERLKKKYGKPVDAVIQNIGASAAYMIAVHADTLYAGRYSLVGSIGVIVDTWNVSKVLDKVQAEKLTFVSGRYKDMLSPYREMRADEKQVIQSMVDKLANVFADEVLGSRKGKITLSRAALTTGQVWVGAEATQLGLIDKIGTIDEVASAHELELQDVGPTERKGFLIPYASSLFENIGASFARGLMGNQGMSVD